MQEWIYLVLTTLLGGSLAVVAFFLREFYKDNKEKHKSTSRNIHELHKENETLKIVYAETMAQVNEFNANLLNHGSKLNDAIKELKEIRKVVEKNNVEVHKILVQFENVGKLFRHYEARVDKLEDKFGKIIRLKGSNNG